RPLVVGAAAQDELHLVARGKQREVFQPVARHLGRGRGLEVDHPRHPRVDAGDVQRTGSLQRDVIAGIAKAPQQVQAALLRQRLAAGDADMAHAMARDLRQDVVDLPPLPAVEGVGGVAVLAAQRAAGQAHEHGRPAGGVGLALERKEDLGDPQAVLRSGGIHGDVLYGRRGMAPPGGWRRRGRRTWRGRDLPPAICQPRGGAGGKIPEKAATLPGGAPAQRSWLSWMERRRSAAMRAASVPGYCDSTWARVACAWRTSPSPNWARPSFSSAPDALSWVG